MKTCLFFLIVMIYLPIQAQEINGKIVDESGLPLSGATIYYDGSTIGTLSRQNGEFSLEQSSQPNLRLVVRYIGYETVYLENLDPNTTYEIELSVQENQLDEIVLDASPFTRKEMLRAFKQDFLGQTRAGRKAKILNEEDIRFYYDVDAKTFYATARSPLRVINEELGYTIEFDLVDFISTFVMVSLDERNQTSNYFGGTSYFKSRAKGYDKRLEKKRLKAYYGSSMHFFKSLITGRLEEEDFEIYHKGFRVAPEKIFNIQKVKLNYASSTSQDREMYKDKNEVTILGNDFDKVSINSTPIKNKFVKKIALLYKNDRTDITFKTKIFYIDDNGNHNPIHSIFFDGEMSKGRLANMLPINFIPNE